MGNNAELSQQCHELLFYGRTHTMNACVLETIAMHQGVMEAGTTTQHALATRPPRHAGTCSSYAEVLAKFCNTYL